MSDHHGNDHHGPLKLNLAEQERESAREMIARGAARRSRRARRQRARPAVEGGTLRSCAGCAWTDPEPDEERPSCARCGASQRARHRRTRPPPSAPGLRFHPGERSSRSVDGGPGGRHESELRPFMDDRYAWLLLLKSGRGCSPCMERPPTRRRGGPGPASAGSARRRPRRGDEEALRLHADSIAEPPKGGES